MTDPFGLMKFAECEHQQLKCEKCGARSDIRGWQTFTGQDKDMLELRDEIDRLTARLAAAEAQQQGEVDEFNAGYKHAMDGGSVHDQPYDCPYDVWEVGFAWAMWNKEKHT